MPKLVDHAARKAAIAEAAARAVAERGIDRVTTHDLAAAAGCTVGALPRYFRNKDAILIAALRHVMEQVRRRAAGALVADGQLQVDPLRLWAEVLPVGPVQRREWRVWLAFSSRAVTAPELRREFRRRYAQSHADTKLLLSAMRDRGALPGDVDLDEAAELLTAVVDGLGIRALLEPRAWPKARQLAHLRRALEGLGWGPVERGRGAGDR